MREIRLSGSMRGGDCVPSTLQINGCLTIQPTATWIMELHWRECSYAGYRCPNRPAG
jgi:hypothetical protein